MNHYFKSPIYIFFGPPGAGKGSQAMQLAKHLDIPHLSSGSLLREEIEKRSSLGILAENFMNQGLLPPQDSVNEMVFERIRQPDCQEGFILDGFPRTLDQSKLLDQVIDNASIQYLINITISDAEVIERLSNRRTCEGCKKTYHLKFLPPKISNQCDNCQRALAQREDDKPQIIKTRLAVFDQNFLEILKHYQNHENWMSIESKGSPSSCFDQLLKKLEAKNSLLKVEKSAL